MTDPNKKPESTVRQLPDMPARYTLVRGVGRGGMGEVFRVIDTDVQRPLAVKVMREDIPTGGVAEQRFLEEARITGQLQHPGVPPVHEVGRLPGGRPFFSMKLIEGRTLHSLLKPRDTPQDDLPRIVDIFSQIAETVAYAHAQGIIHRDLKPKNIMVGAFGEVQVMDWGCAKRLHHALSDEDRAALTKDGESHPLAAGPIDPSAETCAYVPPGATPPPDDCPPTEAPRGLTGAGQVWGTPPYMPPEQACGEIDAIDQRSDVFGLGAILCEILTGLPPYGGPNSLHQAQQADLDDAEERLASCGADEPLMAIARACLSADRDDRPCHAGEVAELISDYSHSVQQRLKEAELERTAAQTRATEERKRRRLVLALALAVVAMVIGVSGGTVWYRLEQADKAQRQALADSRKTRVEEDIEKLLKDARAIRQSLIEELADIHKSLALPIPDCAPCISGSWPG